MGNERRGEVFRHFHALFSMGTVADLTDGELLERFLKREGETAELAFSLLVERHGPMVLSVCRRMLRDPHDAQDAFQATFLVLVRKARAIRNHGSVGSWLYGVACRVSATARAAASPRRCHHLGDDDVFQSVDEPGTLEKRELGEMLHEELLRLPERYRASIVLCYLEGLTHEQAAVRLGRPLTTVRTWLARGREELRGRLSRRGVTLSAGVVATALSANARAAVSPTLAESTVKAVVVFWETRSLSVEVVSASAAALTSGVLRTMFMSKIKLAVALVGVVGVAASSAGVFAYQDPTPKAEATFTDISIKKVAPPLSGEERASAADKYLEKTSREVDASISALQAEVEDLHVRLERAKASLQRMKSLKEALGGKHTELSNRRDPLPPPGLPGSSQKQSNFVLEVRPQSEAMDRQRAAESVNSATVSGLQLKGSQPVGKTPAADQLLTPSELRDTLSKLDMTIEALRKKRERIRADIEKEAK